MSNDSHDSTSAMAHAWFGTPMGESKAVGRVFPSRPIVGSLLDTLTFYADPSNYGTRIVDEGDPEAHKLTDRQIADMAFAVLREHNDNRLWRALTYDSGPYDVTTPTLALCHLARVFFAAGVAAALAGCVDMVQPPDIAVAEELCAKRGGYAHAQRWERGTVLDINCKDGTQLQVRLPKKA